LKKAMGGAIHSVAKHDLGIRLAVAARSAVYNDSKAVWTGPRPKVAWRVGASHVSICFDLGNGGELMLNRSALCPDKILPVYCTGGGFELQINGTWVQPETVSVCGQSVLLQAKNFSAFDAQRIRYAWADWPINTLMNHAGMPARIFNLPLVADMNAALKSCPGGASSLWCKSGGDNDEASKSATATATAKESANDPKTDTLTDGSGSSNSSSLIASLFLCLVTLSLLGFFLVYGRRILKALISTIFPGSNDLDGMPNKSFHSERSVKMKMIAVDSSTGEDGEGMRLMPLTPMPVVSESRWREQQEQQRAPRSNWFWRTPKKKEKKLPPTSQGGTSQGKSVGAFTA